MLSKIPFFNETNDRLPPDIVAENKKFNKRLVRGFGKNEYWREKFFSSRKKENYYKYYHLKYQAKCKELIKENKALKVENQKILVANKRELTKMAKQVNILAESERKSKQMVHLYKKHGRQRTADFLLLRKQIKVYITNKRFFEKELVWFDPKQSSWEKVMNMLFQYENLRLKNIANMKELVLLYTGKQMEYFYIKDVASKFGTEWTLGHQKLLYKMCKLSYVKQIPYKRAWFITELGEKRLQDILESITKKPTKPLINNIP